jgi:hypothetical protein
MFRGAVDAPARFQKRKPRNEQERQAAFTAEQWLWRLTSSVRPLLHLRHGRGTSYAVGWVSDSLLSAYAMMAALDLSRSRQVECETCHSLFISQARPWRQQSLRPLSMESPVNRRHDDHVQGR